MGEVGNTVTGADDRDRAAVGDAAGEGENGAVDANATAANVSACRIAPALSMPPANFVVFFTAMALEKAEITP